MHQRKGENDHRKFLGQSPQKYGTGPGSNSRPVDMQSDMLPTALRGPVGLSFYSTQAPLKCKIFENIMKIGTFAPEEQMFHFS